MAIKWLKDGIGYKSSCGRFTITRFIRRSGVEWGLTDHLVAIPRSNSGACSRLRDAKEGAEWRLRNETPGKPLIEIL